MEEHVYRQLYELEDTHWWFRGRRAVIHALLARTPLTDRPRILDAGCGTGRNITEYAQFGETAGVDPSPDAVAFCHARGLAQVTQSGVEELPFDDGAFDLMTATDVLEHIPDDGGAARELRRVTRPGGHLLVTVPAYQWLWSQHDDSHHHQRRYTLPRLRAVLDGSGLAPDRADVLQLDPAGPDRRRAPRLVRQAAQRLRHGAQAAQRGARTSRCAPRPR